MTIDSQILGSRCTSLHHSVEDILQLLLRTQELTDFSATFTTAGCSATSLGFTVYQIIQFRAQRLSPTVMLVLNCISAALWLSVLVMASVGIAVEVQAYFIHPRLWDRFDGSMLMDCIAVSVFPSWILYETHFLTRNLLLTSQQRSLPCRRGLHFHRRPPL